MATTQTKIIDKNRYSKRYPHIRAPARTVLVSTNEVKIEIGSIYFNNTDTGTLVFEVPFSDTDFRIVATPRDSGVDSADVNVFIGEKLQNSVVIYASSAFVGYVDVFAIRIV